MQKPNNLKDVASRYKAGENIMKLFREMKSSDTNDLESIHVSYDLQAGSYVGLLDSKEKLAHQMEYTKEVAGILDELSPSSLMEAGVGEATTLSNVVTQMKNGPSSIYGFDISWSRLAFAQRYSRGKGLKGNFFIGNLFNIPVADNSIDVVYTSDSIEPNRGKEEEILKELYRVATRYLVLFEPSNDLGNEQTRRRMEEHKYCLNLKDHAEKLGYKVVEHRLVDTCLNNLNQRGMILIEKNIEGVVSQGDICFSCPKCGETLAKVNSNYFCKNDLVVYPVLDGIPCLSFDNSILASHYQALNE